MSEKSHNPESASNPNAEKQKRTRAILRELNQIRRDHGQPDIIIIGDTDKETALDEDREAELAKDRENDLQKDREVDLARGVNVREIASDQDGAAKKEAKEGQQFILKQSEFDPHMQEIVPVKPERTEIELLDMYSKPASPELVKNVEAFMKQQEELEAKKKEYEEIQAKLAELRKNRLVAVGADWSKGEERTARKMARKDLKDELKGANIIKRIWKGTLFRNLYEDKYMDEYLQGERVNKDGETLYDVIEKQKNEMFDQITVDVTEEVREKNDEEISRKIVPMDDKTNNKIKSTIEDYARFMYDISQIRPDLAEDPEFVAEVDEKFDRYMFKILEKAEKSGRVEGYIQHNNYLDVAKEALSRYKEAAKNAKDKVEQDAAMAKVMYGFRAYNYESTKRFSTEHKSNIDKIMDRLGHKKVVSIEAFSKAADAVAAGEEFDEEAAEGAGEEEIIDDIKDAKELIGGDKGVEIMLDKSPISPESQERWNEWWDSLTDEGREYVGNLVKMVNNSPDRYNLAWGNGFRTWLIIKNADKILAA